VKVVRFSDTPTFAPCGHADVLNHALVSTEWHQTPEVGVWWGRFSPGGKSDRHTHEGATQVYVVMSGSFVVADADGEHTLSARDTAIIAPGEPHSIRADEEAEVLVITTPGLR
jgi:quercetin dioxygenase-like cupin family protein